MSYRGIPNYELQVKFDMDDGSEISMTISGRTYDEFKETLDRYRWIHFDGLSVNMAHVRVVHVEMARKKDGE